MALKPLFLLLLWDLTLFVHGVTSLCDVVCSTDYDVSLNCSCSGSVPTYSVLIKVVCSDEELDVHGSCEVKPPQSWCIMYPEKLDEVATIGTMCNTTVSQDGVLMYASDPWALSDVVKPLPPVDVQVTNSDGFYNVTWDHVNKIDCLTYRVHLRETKDLSKDPAHSLLVGVKYILLDREKLKPHVNYTVDVQAKMCPTNVYIGPWSEWSSTAEWRTRGTSAEIEGTNGRWWYFSMPVILVLLVLLGYSKKTVCGSSEIWALSLGAVGAELPAEL